MAPDGIVYTCYSECLVYYVIDGCMRVVMALTPLATIHLWPQGNCRSEDDRGWYQGGGPTRTMFLSIIKPSEEIGGPSTMPLTISLKQPKAGFEYWIWLILQLYISCWCHPIVIPEFLAMGRRANRYGLLLTMWPHWDCIINVGQLLEFERGGMIW